MNDSPDVPTNVVQLDTSAKPRRDMLTLLGAFLSGSKVKVAITSGQLRILEVSPSETTPPTNTSSTQEQRDTANGEESGYDNS